MKGARGVLILFCCLPAAAAERICLSGTVVDASGAVVAGVMVEVRTAQGGAVAGQRTTDSGAFSFCALAPGSYVLAAETPGFRSVEAPARLGAVSQPPLRLVLPLAVSSTQITVTATRGGVEDAASAARVVSVAGSDEVRSGAPVHVGRALEGRPGVLVQETTAGQASPFLRGLTGYQTLLLVDGIRFNTSIFRSGPNQYLGYIEPGEVERVEVMLGPSGADFGSDAMGGAVQVVTAQPRFGAAREYEWHGDIAAAAASGDASAGTDARLSFGNRSVTALLGAGYRRVSDLRAGGGEDSRNVFRRFFGLDAAQARDLLGSRLRGTGLTRNGAHGRLAWRQSESRSIALRYEWNELRGVRSYRDQLGGAGRLQARVEPQALRFAYARFEQLRPGPLDSFSAFVSLNSQEDGTVRQGLRPSDVVTTDFNRVDARGYSAQGSAHAGGRVALLFGGEAYDETVASTRFSAKPAGGEPVQERALFPNGSRYRTVAGFAQGAMELPGRLRAVLGARYTGVHVATSAASNRDAAGRPLGVPDSSRDFRDATFNASLAWQVRGGWGVNMLAGRGFRAPNLTDLGAVGLMSALGFDIPAEDVAGAGALIGADSGDGSASTGKPVRSLRPESLYNFEAGVHYAGRRAYGRVHGFEAELLDPIATRTVLFPAGAHPAQLAGLPLTPIPPSVAQRQQGVTAVATPLSPRGVKAAVNEGRTRYYGLEALFTCALSSSWTVQGNYTFLAGRDLDPNRPVRRLPPQMGRAGLRWVPTGRRPWLDFSLRFAGAQRRLAGGDIDDDRIGASRRRSDIADFFRGGVAAPWVSGGIFQPTGETLLQIQNRVLPLGAAINRVAVAGDGTRVPLYTATSGWHALDVNGGMPITETLHLQFGVANVFDRNYRIHGSGIDAPGISASLGFRHTF